MTDIQVYKTARQRRVAFRAMVADIFNELTEEEAQYLAVVYEEKRGYTKLIDLADILMKQDCIQNSVSDLTLFGENLARAKRKDLQKRVYDYIQDKKPPQDVPERPQPLQARAPSTDWAENENYDSDKSTVSALGYRGKKRRRLETSEDKILEDAVEISAIMLYECDSTSDSSDNTIGSVGEVPSNGMTTPEDKEFIKLAQDAAKNSKDDRTKVGAVVVDTRSGTVLGTGWNRMPKGCEKEFSWARDGPIENGKHLYVVYGVRAAITDAYQNGYSNLSGATLYTTLYPSNVCAQYIMDAEIKKVVYISDKFHHLNFMEASRRILKSITCRQYDDKN